MAATTLIAAVGVGLLGATLPADGFFSGDSGLKLVAALNAIEHPFRPFESDLPKIAGRPVPYVDPMIAVHEGDAHVRQSPLFPVISAPLPDDSLVLISLATSFPLESARILATTPRRWPQHKRAVE